MIDLQLEGHLILMIDVMNVARKVIMLMIVIAIVVGEEAGMCRYKYLVFKLCVILINKILIKHFKNSIIIWVCYICLYFVLKC